jgi:hypothetical protein
MKITKIAKFILTAVVVVLVGGGIASAAPHMFSAAGHRDTVEPSESPSPEPSESPSPEPSESPSPEPSETPEPTGTPSAGPDFSICVGLTGLENAICRHEVLLQLFPDNKGLQNSLSHLEANLLKHQSGNQGHGNGGGNGNGHGNGNGNGHGNGNGNGN